MRSLVVAIGLLAFAASVEAKPSRAATKSDAASKRKASKPSKSKHKSKANERSSRKKRIARIARKHLQYVLRGPVEGQSLGACWFGRLREATKLSENDGWYIRRPHRAYGTAATIGFVERVLADITDRFPDIHPIAIGDISAEQGGKISEHSSHQSGRDVDIGLIFLHKPDAYPASFVVGTAHNLDLEATFVLVEEFAKTTTEPDGAQMIFLDYDVQRLLYNWALENGEAAEYLAKLFQYPRGRNAAAGIVRHEPYHADHIHVRFRCPRSDSACRY